MSSIKDKPLKKKISDKRVTIDTIHNNILDEYNNEILILNKKLSSNNNNKDIINKINEVKNKINEYYLENGMILNDYYSSNNNEKTTENETFNFFASKKDGKKDLHPRCK